MLLFEDWSPPEACESLGGCVPSVDGGLASACESLEDGVSLDDCDWSDDAGPLELLSLLVESPPLLSLPPSLEL
ncbi:hypothetical protein IU494_30320 [Nocardia terpenica]|uniref:hypothetical protein n=1 Tax=Nocardia terpenica TaxID=455432 RepID=UPI001893E8FC|nr:hypothetical protein [Nocardia terpenica]MBF6064944.1 hypothetical protein [Nocardia terpenica]MBF6122538.1 hypothetical protein [Nocardia terpenica]